MSVPGSRVSICGFDQSVERAVPAATRRTTPVRLERSLGDTDLSGFELTDRELALALPPTSCAGGAQGLVGRQG